MASFGSMDRNISNTRLDKYVHATFIGDIAKLREYRETRSDFSFIVACARLMQHGNLPGLQYLQQCETEYAAPSYPGTFEYIHRYLDGWVVSVGAAGDLFLFYSNFEARLINRIRKSDRHIKDHDRLPMARIAAVFLTFQYIGLAEKNVRKLASPYGIVPASFYRPEKFPLTHWPRSPNTLPR